MTPARAAALRAERIKNKRQSRKQTREHQKAEKEKVRWTISKLWEEYKNRRAGLKGV